MSTRIDKIITNLNEHPEDWELSQSKCRLTHKKGLVIWVGNEIFGLKITDPFEYKPGYFARHKLWKNIKPILEKSIKTKQEIELFMETYFE